MKSIQLHKFIKYIKKVIPFILKFLILLIPLVPVFYPIPLIIKNDCQVTAPTTITNDVDSEKTQKKIPAEMNCIRDKYLSIVQIILLIALLELIAVILIRLIEESITTKVRILPFVNNTSNEEYNGKAISDSLIAELHRIYFLNFSEEKPSKLLSRKTSIVTAPQRGNFALPLHFHESMQDNIVDIGEIGLGKATISLGRVIILLSNLLPFNQDQVVTGSVQRYGAITRLVIRVNREGLIHAWEISDEIQSIDSLPQLIKDLAFKLAMMIQRKVIVAEEWEALKFLTEANASYRVYESSGIKQNLDDAYQYCCNALKIERKYEKLAHMFNKIGVAYFNRGEYVEAKEALHNSIAIEPEEAKHYNGIGNVFLSMGLYEEAIEAFETAISYDDKLPYPYNGLGNLHTIKGEYIEAIDKYIEAIRIEQTYDAPYNNIGIVFTLNGLYKEAADKLTQAININKPDPAPLYCSRGWNYLHQSLNSDKKDDDCLGKAVKDLKKSIYLDRKYYLPYGYLGVAYLLKEGGKWRDKAHENWIKCLELCPNKTPFERLTYALYTTALGMKDEKGIEMMKKLLVEAPIKDSYGDMQEIKLDIELILKSDGDRKSGDNIYGLGLKKLPNLLEEHINSGKVLSDKEKEKNHNIC